MRFSRALLLMLALTACGGSSSTAPPAPPPPPPPPPPGGGTPSATATVAVTSSGDGYGNDQNAFTPGVVTVLRSGTVTWNNGTAVLHNVTFAPAAGVPANVVNFSGGSAARSFGTAGTFAYQCTNHSEMTGQVVVQ